MWGSELLPSPLPPLILLALLHVGTSKNSKVQPVCFAWDIPNQHPKFYTSCLERRGRKEGVGERRERHTDRDRDRGTETGTGKERSWSPTLPGQFHFCPDPLSFRAGIRFLKAG